MVEGFVARHGFWAPEFVSRPGALVQPDLRQSLEAPRHVHVTFLLVRLDQGFGQYRLTKVRIAAERTGYEFWQSPAMLIHLIVPVDEEECATTHMTGGALYLVHCGLEFRQHLE